MANYRSYRQVKSDQITAGTISSAKLESGVAPRYCVKHFYGHPCYCTPGCCCYWQVPTGVEKMTIELWGAGGNYFVNTNGGGVTATLPASPDLGAKITFFDVAKTFDSNALTVSRNGKLIQGDSANLTVNTEGAAFSLVFSGDSYGWRIFSI